MEITLIAWRQRSTRVSADQWNEDSWLRSPDFASFGTNEM